MRLVGAFLHVMLDPGCDCGCMLILPSKGIVGLLRDANDHFSDGAARAHANTEARCGDATGASSRRFLRIPASNAPAGANRRSNRRRVARPPAVYRSFGRAALAASSTTSATTPGSSAVSSAALNCLLTAARA